MEKGIAHFANAGAKEAPGQIGNAVGDDHSRKDVLDRGD